ncbi:MAG: hypothetical protein Kow0025_15310 [Thermodesulfovibrionales bacterium]
MMESFKKCPCCGHIWSTRGAFLSDEEIKIDGYVADLEFLEEGLFLFTHVRKGCGSTMALKAGTFRDLYGGPVYAERLRGGDECPGHCLQIHNLERCRAKCECAYVREVIHAIERWPRG